MDIQCQGLSTAVDEVPRLPEVDLSSNMSTKAQAAQRPCSSLARISLKTPTSRPPLRTRGMGEQAHTKISNKQNDDLQMRRPPLFLANLGFFLIDWPTQSRLNYQIFLNYKLHLYMKRPTLGWQIITSKYKIKSEWINNKIIKYS